MRVRANSASGGGGGISPTIVKYGNLQHSSGSDSYGTCEIELDKDYLFIGDYKYNDTTYRQEIQYIHNGGTPTSLTNNWANTLWQCSVSGTTLTYTLHGSGTLNFDYTILQLN